VCARWRGRNVPAGADARYARRDVDSTSWLTIGATRFTLWSDYAPRDQGTGVNQFDGTVATFGGTTNDSSARISGALIEGRVVVLAFGKNTPRGPDWNGVNRGVLSERFAGAAAIAVAQLDAVPPGDVDDAYRGEYAIVRGTMPSAKRPTYF